MKTIEVQITIGSNGQWSMDSPIDLPSGKYKGVLVVEDQPIEPQPTESIISASLENAQSLFRQYVAPNRRLADELIQERRAEALDE
jgi:hypothetical protein